MKKLFFLILITVSIFMGVIHSHASDTDLFATQASPNILIILDNSNSMDEDFFGNAVGSFSSSSKSVVGKKALKDIVDGYSGKLRMGLMTYNVSGVSGQYLHNSPIFASYEPKSYCPNPPPECVTYAQTGDGVARGVCISACQADNPLFDVDYFDEILNNYAIGTEQRTRYGNLVYPHKQRGVNPTDPSRFMYFKHAVAFYAGSNLGTAFCYGTGYSPNEGTSDSYTCYRTKTGTNDDYPSGYSGSSFGISLVPTDSDYALGYGDFSKRWYFYYVGRTWFSNSSPGGGYLQVSVDDLLDEDLNPTATYTNLMNKLDPKENNEAGYMSCGAGDKNTCPYVINAGLTPTAGTFQTATNYYKGVGYTSPIQAWCQKSYIIYVTDGLPSVNESGVPGTADSLMPAVLGKIDTLRNIAVNIGGTVHNMEIKTYVLGVGLSDEDKVKLDAMAVHGGTDVNGHAYYADDPSQLIDALGNIFSSLIECGYSFTSPSVPSVRLDDLEDYRAYISAFTPSSTDPFWPGSLKAYQLNPDGTLPVDASGFPLNATIWSASIPASGSRVIKTYVGGALKDFTTSNLTKGDLGVGSDAAKNNLISYIRNLGLGDIFHSNSVIIGSPSPFFMDEGYSGTGGFYGNNKNRTKVVLAGANDGMLHAFDATTGVEQWAFIPNSLLKNLNSMQTTHTYYVDSSPKVADVWFYNDSTDTTKSADEWKTVLVCGLRKGGKTYFALDITDTLNPKYLWEFPKSSDAATLALVGQSWSEPAIGRVKVEVGGKLYERWVAFIGGGFDPSERPDKDAVVGQAFFVVDIKTGDIIWQFSYESHVPVKKEMQHAFPASPTAVDTNSDGYVDKVYIGDLGGQMWVFDVSFNAVSQKSNSLWTDKADRLFVAPGENPEKHNIYYQPAVAFDSNRIPWVFFGTGDRENPKEWKNPAERFYAVKDDGSGDYPRKENDLKNVTSQNTFTVDQTKKGWYITLDKDKKLLEKVLAKPGVFNQLLYFDTYSYKPTADLCAAAGISKEYVVAFLSGGGALNVDDMSDILNPPSDFVYKRSQQIGTGAPSNPVITVNNKGKASIIVGTTSGQVYSATAFSPSTNKAIMYWREVVP